MKPTPAMFRALRRLAAGRDPFAGLYGQAAAGGAGKTADALIRRGWMTRDDKITEAGRTILAKFSQYPDLPPAEARSGSVVRQNGARSLT